MEDMIKITAHVVVTLLRPASAPFWLENNWEAPPIEAIPSPLGECTSISNVKSAPVTICIIRKNVAIISSGKRNLFILNYTLNKEI
jgi:hypothetical protein